MNVLEKILEEIDNMEKIYVDCKRDNFNDGFERCKKECCEIIRSHMVEKENVTSAEIIRNFIDGKPYYSIKFKETGKDDYTIGYSSYNLAYVIEWLNECFEFCGKAKVISDNGWIPVSEKLPEEGQDVLAQFVVRVVSTNNEVREVVYIHVLYYENGAWQSFAGVPNGKVEAWQPLPKPYKEEVDEN